jgi:hypothetical protein
MDQRRYNVCCGADIHKKFIVATILLLDGTKLTKRFSMDLRSLFEFRDWVMSTQTAVKLSLSSLQEATGFRSIAS